MSVIATKAVAGTGLAQLSALFIVVEVGALEPNINRLLQMASNFFAT